MSHKGSEYLHAKQVYTARNKGKRWQLEGYNASISGTRVFVFKLSLKTDPFFKNSLNSI